jgi:hypothetical protein
MSHNKNFSNHLAGVEEDRGKQVMLKGTLSTICRGPAGFFEAYPGTPAPPAQYS